MESMWAKFLEARLPETDRIASDAGGHVFIVAPWVSAGEGSWMRTIFKRGLRWQYALQSCYALARGCKSRQCADL